MMISGLSLVTEPLDGSEIGMMPNHSMESGLGMIPNHFDLE